MDSRGAPFTIAVANNWDWPSRSFAGRLEVFRINTNKNNAIEHIWQTSVDNGWAGWAPIGELPNEAGSASAIALGQKPPNESTGGCLALFAATSNNEVWFTEQTQDNNGWSDWARLGTNPHGYASQVAAPVLAQNFRLPPRLFGAGIGQDSDGRLEVFGSNPQFEDEGVLLFAWEVPFAGTGGWLGWTEIMGNVGQVATVGQNFPDDRLEVFTIDSSGDAWHLWQSTPGTTSLWGPIEFLGDSGDSRASPQLQQMALGQNADGRLEMFGVDGNGMVFHIWQVAVGDPTSTLRRK